MPGIGPPRRPGARPDARTRFRSPPAFPPAPGFLEDDGSSWLTGQVARAALAGALAGAALAAGAARAQWQDESIPSPHVEEESFAPRVPLAPLAYLALYLPDADEVLPVAAAPPGQPDEDYWTSGVPPTQAALSQRLPLGDPEELAVTAAAPTIVDEDGWTATAPTWPTSVRVFSDDADLVAPKLDDDAWIPSVSRAQAGPRVVFIEQDEVFPAVATLGIDDEIWPLGATRFVTYATLYLPDAGDVPAPANAPAVTLAAILGRQDAYSLAGRQDAATLLGRADSAVLLGRADQYALLGRQDGLIFLGRKDTYSMLGRQDTYSITGVNMPLSAAVSIPLGDDVVIPMTLQDSTGAAFNLTGCTITVGVKKVLTDALATISKTIANGGVVVTNAAGGLANLVLSAADTATLGAGAYPFDVQVTNASAKKSTLIFGTFTLTDHPTR